MKISDLGKMTISEMEKFTITQLEKMTLQEARKYLKSSKDLEDSLRKSRKKN